MLTGSAHFKLHVSLLTKNVSMIVKVREIIFFEGKTFTGAFREILEESRHFFPLNCPKRTLLTPAACTANYCC
jgi:hypothetical protein